MSGKESDEPIQRDPITRSSGDNLPPPDSKPKPKAEADDTEASSPHGVGESVSRHGEDITKADGKEAGRKDTGKEGKAERPTGTSDSRDQTSVDPQ